MRDTRPVDWSAGYREAPPPADLRAALDCIWVRVVPAAGAEPVLVLPDACADLIWREGEGASIAGSDTGPMPAALPPGTVLVGARFRPGAAGPALGVPMSELRDRRVDLSEVRSDLARELPATLSPAAALRLVTDVAARLVSAAPPDPLVRHATGLLAHPRTQGHALAREFELSERQLRRRFHAAIGYGPKTLQRVLRFLRFLRSLDAEGADADLAALAHRAGYADQAHLTRESTRLSGLSPRALMTARSSGDA